MGCCGSLEERLASAIFDGNVKRVGSLLRDRADPSAFVKVERHFYQTSAARVLFTESRANAEAKLQIAAMLWDAGAREVLNQAIMAGDLTTVQRCLESLSKAEVDINGWMPIANARCNPSKETAVNALMDEDCKAPMETKVTIARLLIDAKCRPDVWPNRALFEKPHAPILEVLLTARPLVNVNARNGDRTPLQQLLYHFGDWSEECRMLLNAGAEIDYYTLMEAVSHGRVYLIPTLLGEINIKGVWDEKKFHRVFGLTGQLLAESLPHHSLDVLSIIGAYMRWSVNPEEKNPYNGETALTVNIDLANDVILTPSTVHAWIEKHELNQQCKHIICDYFGLPFVYEKMPRGRAAWTVRDDSHDFDRMQYRIDMARIRAQFYDNLI